MRQAIDAPACESRSQVGLWEGKKRRESPPAVAKAQRRIRKVRCGTFGMMLRDLSKSQITTTDRQTLHAKNSLRNEPEQI